MCQKRKKVYGKKGRIMKGKAKIGERKAGGKLFPKPGRSLHKPLMVYR